jgi:hypothetical protein
MADLISPGVQTLEENRTNVVTAVSTSIAAFAGDFGWGPAFEITPISTEPQLLEKFGKPGRTRFLDYFVAASFLNYGSSLRVVRVIGDGALNASNNASTDALVESRSEFEKIPSSLGIAFGSDIVAKYPGQKGNGLIVGICPHSVSDATFNAWEYKNAFDTAPGTSEYAAANGLTDDELHIIIIDGSGKFTGTKGGILEKFAYVSLCSTAKTSDGASNYYADILNRSSAYVWFGQAPSALLNSGKSVEEMDDDSLVSFMDASVPDAIQYQLSGGVNGSTPSLGESTQAYDMFKDKDSVEVNLIFSPGGKNDDDVEFANMLVALAESRQDCVSLISPGVSATVGSLTPAADVISFANQITSTSYAFMDNTAVQVYDKYNDRYIWIPASGHIAGLCANTDRVADAWWSIAGFNRGRLLGVSKVAFNANQDERDELYKSRVNPIVSLPGQGILLYGDKTALSKPSAFDRINVRRLFNVLKGSIKNSADSQLFEFNDKFTRAAFKNSVEPFLREVQGRRGVTDFRVICDETNNTPQVIDTNNFVGEIYVKPSRSINFITLRFIATRSGVEFSEIVGS